MEWPCYLLGELDNNNIIVLVDELCLECGANTSNFSRIGTLVGRIQHYFVHGGVGDEDSHQHIAPTL